MEQEESRYVVNGMNRMNRLEIGRCLMVILKI